MGLSRSCSDPCGKAETAIEIGDGALRLASQTDPNDPAADKRVRYGYDERSRRESISFPSGVVQEASFDPAGRMDLLTLKNGAGTVLQSFDHDYAANGAHSGNVKQITEPSSSVTSHGYNDLNRLVSASRTGTNKFTESYTYDRNNNRLSITSGGVTRSATYDAANQMTSFDGVSYKYDRNGNLTGYGSNTMEYDAANKWTSGTVNGKGVSFSYDGQGRRVSATIAGARTDYWYDRTGLAQETGANSATYLKDPDGRLLSRWYGVLTNYGLDRQGSITAMTDAGQSLSDSYRYDPWGNSVGATGTRYNEFRYAGTYRDTSVSMYQMGARYYKPSIGRFTQVDPLGSSVFEPNRYHYAGCNPTNYTGPTGLVDLSTCS